MPKIVVTEFISLDGVVDSPGGGDHPRAGWTFKEVEFLPEAYEIKGREQQLASALLLGRQTYEEFAPVWPSMDDFERYNSLPKFVVSTTLTKTDPGWQPTTILRSMDEVAALRNSSDLDGPIYVHGSPNLAQSLAEADLVDQYTLMTFPVVLGSGRRLFADSGATPKLALTHSETFNNGIHLATYDVDRGQN